MPKSRIRYNHTAVKEDYCSNTIAVCPGGNRDNFGLSAPTRKVSFENSTSDSNTSICSDKTVRTKDEKMSSSEIKKSGYERRTALRRKRSLLVRPTTSLSLVDLAKSVQRVGVSSAISGHDDVDIFQGRNSKRVCSFALSPRSVVPTPKHSGVNQRHLCSPQTSAVGDLRTRISSWGHFIDMVPDEYDYDNFSMTAHQNCKNASESYQKKAPRSLCKGPLHRTRRRPRPYGELQNDSTMELSSHIVSFIGLRKDFTTKGNFRLIPRNKIMNKESPDDLIDFFSELNVQHM